MLAASVAVLSLAAGAAFADPAAPSGNDTTVVTQGVAGVDYSYDSLNDGIGHANIYGGELGGIVPFGSDFSGQVTGAYHRIDLDGFGANDWNVAGTVAWDQSWGRLGANVGYDSTGLLGANVNTTNYGVYGEYYGGNLITVGLRGGGVTTSASVFGASGSQTGGYIGGQALGYLTPDLSLRGTLELVDFNGGHQQTAGVRGEWLISETTPISAWVGYDYAALKGGGDRLVGNSVSVGVKWYIGGNGSLLHRQRTGEDDWAAAPVDLTH